MNKYFQSSALKDMKLNLVDQDEKILIKPRISIIEKSHCRQAVNLGSSDGKGTMYKVEDMVQL